MEERKEEKIVLFFNIQKRSKTIISCPYQVVNEDAVLFAHTEGNCVTSARLEMNYVF